jgi:hypothetical protein
MTTATKSIACPNGCGPMELKELRVGNILHCEQCGKAMPTASVKTLKLPGLDPGPQYNTVQETEEPILQRVTRVLQLHGYQVENLVRRRKMQHCETCDSWFAQQGGDGVSKYVGDLLVAIPRGSPCSWILLDTKATNGRGTPEQKDTAAKGLLYFAKSEEQALAAVRQAEEALKQEVSTVPKV